MSKNRRTKKQKIEAQSRHIPLVVSTSGQAHFRVQTAAPERPTHTTTATSNFSVPSHAHVIHDARNTLTITTILIAFDLVIYFLLKLRFINIPGIGF